MSQILDTRADISSNMDAQSLLDHLSGMAYRCRWEGDRIMEYVSRGSTELTGHTPEDLCGDKPIEWSQLIHPDDLVAVMKVFRRAVDDRKPFRTKYRLELSDGRTRSVTEEGCIVSADGEYPRYIEGYVLADVDSPGLDAGTDLPDESGRNVLDQTRDAFVAVDSLGKIVAWNRQSELTFGWSSLEAIGQDLGDLLVPPDQLDQFRARFRKLVESPSQEIVSSSKNLHIARRTGEPFPVELTIWPGQDENGIILNAFVHDLSERRAIEEQLAQAERSLKQLSRDDSVTGLASRRTLEDELVRAVSFSRRWGQPLSLLVIGPDDSAAGRGIEHAEWDELMIELASQLRSTCRVEDLPARLDGERLAVLLPNTTIEKAQVVANRIQQNLKQHPLSRSTSVSVSLGLSTLLDDDDQCALVERAMTTMKGTESKPEEQNSTDAGAEPVTEAG